MQKRKYHECHTCPHNMTGSKACLKCKGPSPENNASETSRHGVSMLSIDAMVDNHHEGDCATTFTAPETFYDPETISLCPVLQRKHQMFQDFFRRWIAMSMPQRNIIALRIAQPGWSNRAIAEYYGITEQHVSSTIKVFFAKINVRIRQNQKRNARFSGYSHGAIPTARTLCPAVRSRPERYKGRIACRLQQEERKAARFISFVKVGHSGRN